MWRISVTIVVVKIQQCVHFVPIYICQLQPRTVLNVLLWKVNNELFYIDAELHASLSTM